MGMTIPPLPKREPKKSPAPLSFKPDQDDEAALKSMLKKKGIDKSDFLRWCLKVGLNLAAKEDQTGTAA